MGAKIPRKIGKPQLAFLSVGHFVVYADSFISYPLAAFYTGVYPVVKKL